MKTKALGEICRPKQWKTVSVSQLCENGYPVYGANGVIGKYKDFNHKKETILVTCRGATCGTLNICAPFSYVNGNAMALDSLDKSVDLRYLYFFLKGRGFHDVISGSAQPQIIRSAIERIEVPICNIGTQKEITKRFTKIEDIIKNKKRLLADLDNLIKARFVEMFGGKDFEKKSFKSVCEELFAGGDVKRDRTVEDADPNHPYPVFTNGEKDDGLYGYTDIARVTKPSITISGRGTIGFCLVRAEPFYPAIRLIVAIPKENLVTPSYLKYFIDSKDYSGHGASIPQLTIPMIKDEPVPIPPIKIQKEFESIVAQVDKSKFALQNNIKSLMNLWYNTNSMFCERTYGEA